MIPIEVEIILLVLLRFASKLWSCIKQTFLNFLILRDSQDYGEIVVCVGS